MKKFNFLPIFLLAVFFGFSSSAFAHDDICQKAQVKAEHSPAAQSCGTNLRDSQWPVPNGNFLILGNTELETACLTGGEDYFKKALIQCVDVVKSAQPLNNCGGILKFGNC